MALSTYAELKTAIQNYAARSDTAFTDRIDDFIDLAEDRIHFGGEDAFKTEPLRILGMETSADLSISTQEVAQPTGWLESKRLYINSSPLYDVDYLPPDRFWASDAANSNVTGKPIIYTTEGTNFVFAYSPDSTYTGKLLYYKKLDPLSDSATTNWLITNSPATYLYACLLEYSIWAMDDRQSAKYAALFQSRINGMFRQDNKARHSGSTLRVRVDQTP